MIEVIILYILRNIINTFLAVSLTKLYVSMIDLVNQWFFREEKMQSINLLKQFLKKMNITKKKKKRQPFNKNLVMSVEDERRFQTSNKWWIFNI